VTPGGALDPQGPVAGTIADLWWLLFWLGLVVFGVFVVLLGIGLRRRGGEPTDPIETTTAPDDRRLGRWLVGWGVVAPTIVLVVVFGATIAAMVDLPTAASADDPLVVEVVGRQWTYEVTYPEQGFSTTDELHLPVGREVELRLTSDDVIHSFWVPELGGKIDMMPGRVNTLVLQADVEGEHQMRCAEFCGLEHARMMMPVVSEDAADFQRWVDARSPDGDQP